jgi:rod shape-determining protein MreD
MINPYLAAFIALIVTLFQAQFLPGFLPAVSAFVPDLSLLLVIAWALLLDWRWSLPIAFGTGILMDFVNTDLYPLGTHALMYTVIGAGASLVGQNPAERGGIMRAVPTALVGVLVFRVARLILERILGYNNFQVGVFLQVILPVAIIDAALMVVIWGFARLFSRPYTT